MLRASRLSCLVAVFASTLAVSAQTTPQDPPTPRPPALFGQEPEVAPPTRPRPTPVGLDRQQGDQLRSAWSRISQQPFQGFPVFPAKLSQYGSYPLANGANGQLPFLPTLPPNEPEVANWPSWVRLRERAALPFTAEHVLLVRNADRVWWRKNANAAFVPLFFHDKIEVAGVGAEVQVRQTGEFELVLHDSGRVIALGPTELAVTASDPTKVTLDVRSFTKLRVYGNRREHAFRLPNGSTLTLPAAAEDTELPGSTLVLLDRAEEPGWFGGRATVFNAGPRDVTIADALATTTLAPGHRLTIFLRQPGNPIPAALDAGDATAKRDGAAITLQDADGGAVSWCGARFTLGAGGTVRFDPMLGSPFDPREPAAKSGERQ